MIKINKELFQIRAKVAKCLIYSIFCLFPIASFAIPADSTKKKTPRIIPVVKYFNEISLEKTIPATELQKIDTVLDMIEVFNPAFKHSYKYLGNLGTAAFPNLFAINNRLGMNIGFHNYDLFFFSLDSIKYYRTNKPFTELQFGLGSKSEGYIKVTHTQNMNEQFNFGFNYNRIGSDGSLPHQNTSVTNFDFFSWYNSKNLRYNALATGIWNVVKNQENGGLKSNNDSTNSGLNDIAQNLNLVSLQNANTRYNNRIFYVKQSYDFGFHSEVKINDTITIQRFKPTQRVAHSITYETNSYTFEDSLEIPGFYRNFYPDSAHTSDTTYYSKLTNKISWGTLDNKNKGDDSLRYFGYLFDLSHEIIWYHQRIIDSSLQNGIAGGAIHFKGFLHLKLSGNYCFYGANKGSYSALFKEYAKDSAKVPTAFLFSINSVAPTLMQNRYEGNNYSWNNHFNPINFQAVTFEINGKKRNNKLDFRLINISNYIYYDTASMPVQARDSVVITQIELSKNFQWHHLHFDNNILYQKALHTDKIRLPEFTFSNSLFIDHAFFHHALQTQFGVDFRYHSHYFGDAYMPVTGQFYLQDKYAIGDYPLLDIFLNIKIRTARIYLRGENVLNNFHPAESYYLVPNYAMPVFGIKFGIIWQFFD